MEDPAPTDAVQLSQALPHNVQDNVVWHCKNTSLPNQYSTYIKLYPINHLINRYAISTPLPPAKLFLTLKIILPVFVNNKDI